MSGRICVLVACAGGSCAWGQSLFAPEARPGAPAMVAPAVAANGASRPLAAGADPAAPLYGVSMFALTPPEPRTFAVHDLVTILIDETSRSSSSQTLETEKKLNTRATLNSIADPLELLEARLREDVLNVDLIDAKANRKYEGEGEYERQDRFIARVTGQIIDVKPNGTLVVEARKRIVRDEEETVIVLAGVCRQEDVTVENTVLSSQMADLRVEQHNEGAVKQAAKKGFLTNVLDAVFNF